MSSPAIPPIDAEVLELEALRVLERLEGAEFPDKACLLLAKGIETPALVELAGAGRPSWFEATELWGRFLTEYGLPPLTPEQAIHYLILPPAQAAAAAYLRGQQSAWELLQSLEDFNSAYGHPEVLHDFCPLYSEWAYLVLELEDPAAEKRLAGEVQAAAVRLAARRPLVLADPESHDPLLYRASLPGRPSSVRGK